MTVVAGQSPTIVVNGTRELPWTQGMTVRDVLRLCNFTYSLIIVTVNGRIVPKEEFDTFPVPPEAEVRVIHLIAGG